MVLSTIILYIPCLLFIIESEIVVTTAEWQGNKEKKNEAKKRDILVCKFDSLSQKNGLSSGIANKHRFIEWEYVAVPVTNVSATNYPVWNCK